LNLILDYAIVGEAYSRFQDQLRYTKILRGESINAIETVLLVLALLRACDTTAGIAQAASESSSLSQSAPQPQTSPATDPHLVLDTHLVQARSLTDEGKADDGEREIRQYLSAHPQSAEGHFLLGYILFREIQQNARTTASCVETSANNSCDPATRVSKARASLAEYTEGAKYSRPTAADLKIVALDYILLADYPDADKWLTKMLQWAPNDADGWYLLGRTKYNENQFEPAARSFEQSLKLDAKSVKAEDNLGLCYAALGRSDEAAAAYRNAIAWQQDAPSKNPGPLIDMADLLLNLSKPDEAIAYLQQAVDISPRDFKPHELLGKAYLRLERTQEAQQELEKAALLAPDVANVHCMLVTAYRKQALMDKAKIEADRCAALTGTHSSSDVPRQ
jgi:Flp pilus assembly protein TadD